MDLYRTSTACVEIPNPATGTGVRLVLIASDTLVKTRQIHPSEFAVMQLVHASTSIPIPTPRRFIHDGVSNESHIVMEYVSGRTLDQCWANLSLWRQILIVRKLRCYVRQLRTVQPAYHHPGPVSSTPQTCFGWMFTEYVRAFIYLSNLFSYIKNCLGCRTVLYIFWTIVMVRTQAGGFSQNEEGPTFD